MSLYRDTQQIQLGGNWIPSVSGQVATLPNYVATRSGDKSPNFKNKDRTVSDVTFRCSDTFESFKRDTWSTSLQRVKNAFGSSSF